MIHADNLDSNHSFCMFVIAESIKYECSKEDGLFVLQIIGMPEDSVSGNVWKKKKKKKRGS